MTIIIKLKLDLYNELNKLKEKYIVVKWKWEYTYWLVNMQTAEVFSFDEKTKEIKNLWFKSLDSEFFRNFYDKEIILEKVEEKEQQQKEIKKENNRPKILTPEQMKAKLSGEKSLF